MPEDWQSGGFGLYIHWPFCQAKCPYCDFNSHVVSSINQTAWQNAYLSEIDRIAAETDGRILKSVFFGGGTPSMMDANLVQAILDRVRASWSVANDIEITLEANPTSVEATRFEGYRMAGVNRVSMGVQALNNADLRALGRLHDRDEALAAFEIARSVFERVSFDLIYARQNQTLAAWEAELKEAMDLDVDHLSLYQLTIEEGTAFGDRFAAGKLRGLPENDLSADMYELTQELSRNAGLPTYEVSNHAKPGAESVHNRIYWRYGDYAGIGPGAHGRLTIGRVRYATEAPLAPAWWLQQVARDGHGEAKRVLLSASDQASEFLLMGLRLVEGVSLERLRRISDVDYSSNIKKLEDIGMLEVSSDTLCVSSRGRPVLNAVLRELLTN